MSRPPPTRFRPPSFTHQPYYPNPDYPIPFRGSQTDLRSPTTTSQASTFKQEDEEEEDDSNLPDGGWGKEGPLIKARRAMARRGRKEKVNSIDKTAVWLKTSQSGSPAGSSEQPITPITSPHAIPASHTLTSSIAPASHALESNSNSGSVNEEHEAEPQTGSIDADGWPISGEAEAGSGKDSKPEIPKSPSPQEVIETPSSNLTSSSEEAEVVIGDPPPNVDNVVASEQLDQSLNPAQGQGYVYINNPPSHIQPPWRDPNVLNVVNPRRWGQPNAALELPPSTQPQSEPTGIEAWEGTDTLSEWRQQVSRHTVSADPLDAESGEEKSEQVDVEIEVDGPDRPDSAPPVLPPVIAYISSEDGSEVSTPRQPETELPPAPIDEANQSTDTAKSSISHVIMDGQVIKSPPRTPRPKRARGPGTSGAWWKREPHPISSAEFAARRLLVTFPFPIRANRIRPIMMEHFARYGRVRFIQPVDVVNEGASSALVVFSFMEGVENCFADPNRHDCISKSYPTSSRFNITIEPAPLGPTYTIFVKITGPRCDQRSRSASPSPPGRPRESSVHDYYEDYRPLPPFLTIWGVPEYHRSAQRVNWRACIVAGHEPPEMIVRQAVHDTGSRPCFIERIALDRRVPAKDIVPKLCDFFSEIVSVQAPETQRQGWLITITGQRDGERLLDELSKVQGITSRWAVATDHPTSDGSNHSPVSLIHTTPPLTPSVKTEFPQRRDSDVSVRIAQEHDSPSVTRSLPSEYPGLTKTLVPTYRGRLLKEELVDGSSSRFIDESAIFVGRLVKETETVDTLFSRFAKYGMINGIEYNTRKVLNTYATARILYSDRSAADRALRHEAEAVSHGSGLKIERRKVLPQDVQMREMYIDEFGRPVSPSMVSQYSPPHIHEVPTWPLPTAVSYPVPPLPPTPMTPNFGPVPTQMGIPHETTNAMNHPQSQQGPSFYPVFIGPGMPMPPPPPGAPGGYGSSLPYGPPLDQHLNMAPPVGQFIQYPPAQAHNLGYVPVYASLPTTVVAEEPVPSGPHQSAGMGSTGQSISPTGVQMAFETPVVPPTSGKTSPSHGNTVSSPNSGGEKHALQALELKEEKGVLKAVYDPEQLRKYQEERGYDIPLNSSQEVLKNQDDFETAQPERPHSSPNFDHPDIHGPIEFGRRRSLAFVPPDLGRQQEVLTPIPIPFTNHLPQPTQYPPETNLGYQHLSYSSGHHASEKPINRQEGYIPAHDAPAFDYGQGRGPRGQGRYRPSPYHGEQERPRFGGWYQ